MKIHHLRSASFVIESGNNFILVDPMLGEKGTLPPFAFFRHKPRKNPYVGMPVNSKDILSKVTHVVITHLHPDHLDAKGYEFLKVNNIPVVCNKADRKKLMKKGLNIILSLEYQKPIDFLNGKVIGIPARHGYGFIAKPMGNVMGFYIELPNEPSIYISSDTIYTNDVENALVELKPDISVLAAGSAQFDIGGPLLMNIEDIAKFITKAPNKVYANHMEAINHCPTDRNKLKQLVTKIGAQEKVIIPSDGESFELKS